MTPAALVVAFGSGVVSFLAPCTVPLLPAYVGVLSGSAVGVSAEAQTARLVRGSVLYVIGFTAVFVALGVAAGSLGGAVRATGGPVQRIGGVLVLTLAAGLLADARLGGSPGWRRVAIGAVPGWPAHLRRSLRCCSASCSGPPSPRAWGHFSGPR